MRHGSWLMLAAAMTGLTPAFAAQRTFVSTSGNDTHTANNCSLALPCRSFDKALTVTDASGEIVVLDSGGYGSVTVDKSVVITSPAGVYAGISVFAGKTGVVVDSPGVIVTLRGLTINGQGGDAGIDFVHGARLIVENCEVANFGGASIAGIVVRAPGGVAVVRDTIIHDMTSTTGIFVVQYTSGQVTKLFAENVAVHNAEWGFYAGTIPNLGTAEAYLNRVTVTGATSFGVTADGSGAGAAFVSITNSTITDNDTGVLALHSGATAVVATSVLTRNANFALSQVTGATLLSRGDNTVYGNNGGGAQNDGTIGPMPPL